MNSELKKWQNWFPKKKFKLMNSAVFRKIMEKGREHRDIKLGTTKTRRKSGIGTKLSNNKIFISNKNDTPE